MAGPRQSVDAPPATPPLYSLLDAVQILENGDRWQGGVVWSPEQRGGGGAVAVACDGTTDEMVATPNPIRDTADPFVVFAEDHCTTLVPDHDFEGRARRQLAAVQSAKIARELQLGEIRDAESLGNVALIDGIEVGPGGQDVEAAIGVLEGAMADAYSGARGMVHVTPQTLVEMGRKNLIYQRPGSVQWLTYPGNVVVMDAGYVAENGEAPPDAGVFAYGTTMIQVRLSAVEVNPPSILEAIDRGVNLVELFAQRLALVQFDHSDAVLADLVFKVEIDLPPWHLGS